MVASPPDELTVRSGRVKHARRLATRAFRADQREFLAEGPQAVREALATDHATVEVFATVDATDQHVDLVEAARRADVPWHVVTDDVVEAVADTVQPQGVVARCTMLDRPLAALLDREPSFVVVCADIRDPGNAGAVIRCADAAGADGVVFVGDSVDPYNPKSVRATVGSLFHVPIAIERDVVTSLAALQAAGLTVALPQMDVHLHGLRARKAETRNGPAGEPPVPPGESEWATYEAPHRNTPVSTSEQ